MKNYENLLKELDSLKSKKLSDFTSPILATKLKVLGIYSKDLKSLIKEYKDIDISTFELDKIYEINFLYFAIGLKQIKSLSDQFNFIINNKTHLCSWGITDSTYQSLIFLKFDEMNPYIKEFLKVDNELVIRYGYLILFKYLKDEKNLNEIFSLFTNSKYFYVEMVEAWVLSYLYIYHPEITYDYLKSSNLNTSIKTKAYRKILDSYQVNKENKEKIKQLRNITNNKI